MMDIGEYLDGIMTEIPRVSAEAGVDPDAVMDDMVSDFMALDREDAFARSADDRARVEGEYHDAARRGIMRVSGISSGEYDRVLSGDPALMAKLRSDYMATI